MSKNALITGPTNGIGRETAIALAKRGFKLFLLCRNEAAGQALCNEISTIADAKPPVLLIADLGDFEAVKKAAQQVIDSGEPLHVLINNAGVVNTQRIMVDGQEQMFRVNHLGHYLLTRLLLPLLKSSAPSRIVVVASDAHAFFKGIQFEDLTFADNFSTFKTYGHSKLANMLMVLELSKMLEGSGVVVNSLHPGAVASRLGAQNTALWGKLLMKFLHLFFLSPKEGADTSIYLATADITDSGNYYYKRETRGSKPWARDAETAKKLWDVSEQLVADYLPEAETSKQA